MPHRRKLSARIIQPIRCVLQAECSSQGGSGSGTCASGFGSCCLFFSDTCGGTISRNRTYIRNPGYSSSYSTAGTCTWTLAKSQTNICQIRLDFDESSISQPSNAAGVAGDCSTVDYFRVGFEIIIPGLGNIEVFILVFYL